MMRKIRNFAHKLIGTAWAMSTANFSRNPQTPSKKEEEMSIFKRKVKKPIALCSAHFGEPDLKNGRITLGLMSEKKELIIVTMDATLAAEMMEELGEISVGVTRRNFEAKDQMYR